MRGHAFDEANTYIEKRTGQMSCRACRRLLYAEVRPRISARRKELRASGTWYPAPDEIEAVIEPRKPEEIAAVEEILTRMVIKIDQACDRANPLPSPEEAADRVARNMEQRIIRERATQKRKEAA